MKRIIIIAVVAAAAVMAVKAQSSAFFGSWSGTLTVGGQKLPLVFNISEKGCTMDSPNQGAKGIKATFIEGDYGQVKIGVPSIGATYDARLVDDELQGTFKQSGMSFALTLQHKEMEKPKRPQTPAAPFPYTTEELSFSNGGIVLNGTLTLPENCTRETPVVVMVTGSGMQNRDEEIFDHKPFAVIADALARDGIASFRYDDRGYDQQGKGVENSTTYDMKDDADSAITLMRKRFDRVGVVGHSEGGSIALLLAEEGKTDFIVSIAGMVCSGKTTILRQNDIMLTRAGVPEDIKKNYCTELDKAFTKLAKGAPAESIKASKEMPLVLKQNFETAIRQSDTPWLRAFLALDPSKDLGNIKCSVLALNGTMDKQVDCESNLGALRKGLKTSNATIKEMKGLNHLMQHCQTGMADEYGTIEETISPEVLRIICNWIKAL